MDYTHKFNQKEWEKIEKEQNRIVDSIIDLIKAKQKNITIQSPTGSGKSIMIKKMIEKLCDKYYFVIRTLSKCGLEKQLKQNMASINKKNFFIYGDASIGRKNNKLGFDEIKKEWKQNAGKRPMIYIKDECHIQDTAADIHGYDDFLCKIDFSATPENDPDVIGDFEKTPMLKKLVEFQRIIDNEERNAIAQIKKVVIEAIEKLIEIKKIYIPFETNPALIIKTSGFFHIDELQLEPYFKKNDIKYIYIDQNTPWDELNKLRENNCKYSIIITKEKIKEGFDIPRAAVCVWTYSNTKYSISTYTQLVGRCRRNCLFLLDQWNIKDIPETLQTAYVFKTHLLVKEDEFSSPDEFNYKDEIIITGIKNTKSYYDTLLSDTGKRLKYHPILIYNYPKKIYKVIVDNWYKDPKNRNYNFFTYFTNKEKPKKIDILEDKVIEKTYVDAWEMVKDIDIEKFGMIYQSVKGKNITEHTAFYFDKKFFVHKYPTETGKEIIYQDEKMFRDNLIEIKDPAITDQIYEKLLETFITVCWVGYKNDLFNTTPTPKQIQKANEANELINKYKETINKNYHLKDYYYNEKLLKENRQLEFKIKDIKYQIRNYLPVRDRVCYPLNFVRIKCYDGEPIELFSTAPEWKLIDLISKYTSFMKQKKYYEEALNSLDNVLFKMLYWHTFCTRGKCTRPSTPIKQYLVDHFEVLDEKEILSKPNTVEYDFHERDKESASVIEYICKDLIAKETPLKVLGRLDIEKYINEIRAKKNKTEKIYTISRSKHKEEIFDNIIKGVKDVMALLLTKLPKSKWVIETKTCLFGESDFIVNNQSFCVKMKKKLSQDDIYQQILNALLFKIDVMYLVCPLQEEIYEIKFKKK